MERRVWSAELKGKANERSEYYRGVVAGVIKHSGRQEGRHDARFMRALRKKRKIDDMTRKPAKQHGVRGWVLC